MRKSATLRCSTCSLGRVRIPLLYIGVTGLLVLGLLAGCGQDSATSASVSGRLGSAERFLHRVGRTSCFKAHVFLGAAPGEIKFVVFCRSQGEADLPYFGVGRYSLTRKPARPGYRRIWHYPLVKGPGAVKPFGLCSRFGSGIACSARSTGEVKVQGGFYVDPEKRCSQGVSVTAPLIHPLCKRGDCPAPGGDTFLTSGRPRGC